MKTKLNLTLLIALFAGFAFVSCEQLPDELVGEFPITGVTGGKYTITLTPVAYNNANAKGIGYVRAYMVDAEGKETLVNRANTGDKIYLRASAYENFDFIQWFASGNITTLEEAESDITEFTMPEGDVEIEVWFDDTTIPMPSASQFIANNIPTDKAKEENVKLRAWKAAQTSQVFVWFDAWSGRVNDGANSMRGLPDEVTIIANWGQPKWNLSSWQKADMQYVQEVKGTKVVFTLFSENIGDGALNEDEWKHVRGSLSTDEATMRPAIAAYAKGLYERCLAEGYDGYDWDFEPTASGKPVAEAPLWRVPQQAGWFIEELSYYFGPQARKYTLNERRTNNGINRGAVPTKDLLFLVDGEVHNSNFSTGVNNTVATTYVSYYVQQAYNVSTVTGCNNRLAGIVSQLQQHIDSGKITKEEVVSRCILTENFEEPSNLDDGNGLTVMAGLKTYEGFTLGGFGAYRIGLSYDQSKVNDATYSSPGWEGARAKYYVWLRKGIDLQYGEGPRQ